MRRFDPVSSGSEASRGRSGKDDCTNDVSDAVSPLIAGTGVGQTPYVSGLTLYDFAEQLKSEGDCQRAITEYKRLLYLHPSTEHRYSAIQSMLACYYALEQYEIGHKLSLRYLPQCQDERCREWLRFFSGKCCLKLNDYQMATTILSQPNNEGKSGDERILLLKGLAHAHLGEWDMAQQAFKSIDHRSRFQENAQLCSHLCEQGRGLKPKSGAVAGLLSIIPGLGYLYSGHSHTALSAFVVNSLFFLATYEAFHNNHNATGVVLSIISFGWYTGSIYGSIRSARERYDHSKTELMLRFDVGFTF